MTGEKKEIESREEVSLLVRSFYAKIRLHAKLGPIFNGIVKDWEQHLERLTDFWEMVLLQTGPGSGKFNPIPVHKEVDNFVNNEIEQRHFGNWLELFLTLSPPLHSNTPFFRSSSLRCYRSQILG
jgi:hemoglobin